MAIVAIIPGLLAFIVAARRGAAEAFLAVYVPLLLIFPDYFRWIAPGLPDPTMNQAAIIPIALFYFIKRGPRWRFSFGDIFVFGFAVMTAYTEYRAKNYADAQNLMFDQLCSVVLPYVLAKGLIEPNNLRVAFARKLVVMMGVVTIMSLYEFKMGRPLIRIFLDPFFPGQGSWVTTFWYGFARVAGPYGHAILAGMIFVTGYRIQRWLEWTGEWQGRAWVLPITKARAFTWLMGLGVFITLVRGPIFGGIVGAFVLIVARARNRRMVAYMVLAAFIVVGTPAGLWFKSYVSVGRAGAKTVSQETAAYRAELIEKYTAVAAEHAMWGWGRGLWPTIDGMSSSDNHYLLLALNHGLVTLALFLGITINHAIRLGRFGSRRARNDPSALLAFTLIGCYLSFFVSLATVYHGMQSVQIFFMIAGWGEGLLAYPHAYQATVTDQTPAVAPAGPFRFRRITA